MKSLLKVWPFDFESASCGLEGDCGDGGCGGEERLFRTFVLTVFGVFL